MVMRPGLILSPSPFAMPNSSTSPDAANMQTDGAWVATGNGKAQD
jgi:hypothetical protein